MTNDDDGRSSAARGYVLASRVTSIGMQMTIPAIIGWWADGKLQTTPWLLVLGTLLGFVISMLELLRFAKDSDDSVR